MFWGYSLLPCHPFSPPSCPLEVEIGASPDEWCIHDAIVTACVFSRRAQTTPLSEEQEVLFPSHFRTLVSLLQRGGGGGRRSRVPDASNAAMDHREHHTGELEEPPHHRVTSRYTIPHSPEPPPPPLLCNAACGLGHG